MACNCMGCPHLANCLCRCQECSKNIQEELKILLNKEATSKEKAVVSSSFD